MAYRSWLQARALPGQRAALVQAFIERRVLEECRTTIAGFLRGELLLAEHDADVLCVCAEWVDHQAFLDWQASPVRAAQAPALMPWLQAMPVSELFRAVHAASRDTAATGAFSTSPNAAAPHA